MKDNVKFMKNLVRMVIVGIIILFVASTRLYAANPVNVNIDNIGSLDFMDIPEEGTGTNTGTAKQASDGARGTSGEESNANNENTKNTSTVTSTTTNKKNSSSASKEKIPATGSNAEIIFVVGIGAILSAGIVVFKKQSIKLK